MRYRECSVCGQSLDPAEICDCRRHEQTDETYDGATQDTRKFILKVGSDVFRMDTEGRLYCCSR